MCHRGDRLGCLYFVIIPVKHTEDDRHRVD